MNKDEILAKSRNENKVQDERELQIHHRAGYIAMAAGGVVCCLICFFIRLLSDELGIVNTACFMVYTCMGAVEGWISAIMVKNKKALWVSASVYTVLFLLFIIFLRRN